MIKTRVKKRRRANRKNWMKSLIGLVLVAIILAVIPGAVSADKESELVILSNGNRSKREVVYAKLDASGAVDQIYVVNHFHPTQKTNLTDYGDYESVVQLTGSVPPVLEGSTITMEGVEGHYYYQGNMNSNQLPWDFIITYRLDGQARQPLSLSGVSGRLEMELGITQNEAVDSSFFEHYALQISIPVDPDRVIIEEASEGFLVSSAGIDQQLNYIILPGQETVIKLVMDVNDFAMGQITLAGVLMSFDIDLSEMEEELEPLDQLTEGIAGFAEGAGQLKSGYGDLLAAFRQIKSGAGELADGGRKLEEGVGELEEGARTLLSEGNKLKKGSKQVLDGLTMITDNLPSRDLVDSFDLPEFSEADIERLHQASEFIEMLGKVLEILGGYEEEMENLRTILQELIELIRSLDLPDSVVLPDTPAGWEAYLEERYGFSDPLPDEVYQQLANLGKLSKRYGDFRELMEVLSELLASLPDLDMSATEMLGEIGKLLDKADDLVGMIETAGPMIGQIGDLIDGLNELQRGYAELHGGLTRYIDEGIGGLATGIEGTNTEQGLSSGTSEYVGGVSALNDGLNQYYSSGLTRFADGVNQLSSGASQMRDETGDLRSLFEEAIREKLDEFTNEGFEISSFVSERNTEVSSVQFVFMTAEIPPAGS
ncbi:MAG: hypothetical protein GX838_04585 [Clostridiaceae bacterium]|nr:hypothetical protein [Clostridiaceae bacterium]